MTVVELALLILALVAVVCVVMGALLTKRLLALLQESEAMVREARETMRGVKPAIEGFVEASMETQRLQRRVVGEIDGVVDRAQPVLRGVRAVLAAAAALGGARGGTSRGGKSPDS